MSIHTVDPRPASELWLRFREAMAGGRGVFRVPSGVHRIHGGWLPERFCHVSNNDHGLKRVLFDVGGVSNFVLDGQGATLSFVGEVLPIRVGQSSGVTVCNLTIDWQRPFFTQAVVEEAGPGWLRFRVASESYPLRVDGGRLIAHDGGGWQTDALWNLLPFDSGRREVATRIENWHLGRWHRAKDEGGGVFRLEAAFAEVYAAGTPIVLMHGNRVAPGIWVEESKQVAVRDVTIHHSPGMGVIAQLSRDVTYERVRVVPSGDRLFSTWVDAFHMVDCDGCSRVLDCEASGQFDDGCNIHASFARVAARRGERRALLQLVHPQRFGRNAATPGATVAFYRRRDLVRVLVTEVVSAVTVNQEVADVSLKDALPVGEDELVCSRFDPESTIEVRGCRFGANRGRGVLLNMEHRAVVEGNHFHVSGRAIESVSDANYWWEGSPAQDLTIQNNTFEDCGFGPCGEDLIYVGPELPDGADPRAGPLRQTGESASGDEVAPVIGTVRVVNNTVVRHRGKLVHAHGVDRLVVSGNRVTDSTRYPVLSPGAQVEVGKGVRDAAVEGAVI